jgi:hypothetical protein
MNGDFGLLMGAGGWDGCRETEAAAGCLMRAAAGLPQSGWLRHFGVRQLVAALGWGGGLR